MTPSSRRGSTGNSDEPAGQHLARLMDRVRRVLNSPSYSSWRDISPLVSGSKKTGAMIFGYRLHHWVAPLITELRQVYGQRYIVSLNGKTQQDVSDKTQVALDVDNPEASARWFAAQHNDNVYFEVTVRLRK